MGSRASPEWIVLLLTWAPPCQETHSPESWEWKSLHWSMWMLTTYAENVSLGFLLPDVYSLGWLSFRVLTLRLANPPPCAEHTSCWVSRLHSRCLRQNKYSPPNPSFSAYMPVSSSFPSHPRHVCRTSHWTWQAIPCLIWLIPSQTSLKRTEII